MGLWSMKSVPVAGVEAGWALVSLPTQTTLGFYSSMYPILLEICDLMLAYLSHQPCSAPFALSVGVQHKPHPAAICLTKAIWELT